MARKMNHLDEAFKGRGLNFCARKNRSFGPEDFSRIAIDSCDIVSVRFHVFFYAYVYVFLGVWAPEKKV